MGENTEDETTTPCQYDEGSPLVQGDFVIGIMSKIKGNFFNEFNYLPETTLKKYFEPLF